MLVIVGKDNIEVMNSNLTTLITEEVDEINRKWLNTKNNTSYKENKEYVNQT